MREAISGWKDGRTPQQIQAIVDTGFAPLDDREPALLIDLDPGAYTPLLQGPTGDTGTAIVEIFDVSGGSSTPLINVSARAYAGTGDDVLIGGTVVVGEAQSLVLIRALGPSLAAQGVAGVLPDPTLQLFTGDGVLLTTNQGWKDGMSLRQIDQLTTLGLSPGDEREAALLVTLDPGSYTAVVTGAGGTTGVGLMEIFEISIPLP